MYREYSITYQDWSPDRHYTAVVPSSDEWYHSTRHSIRLNGAESEEMRRLELLRYRCDWDLSYKTVADSQQANQYPYSYRILSEAAIERLLRESSDDQ